MPIWLEEKRIHEKENILKVHWSHNNLWLISNMHNDTDHCKSNIRHNALGELIERQTKQNYSYWRFSNPADVNIFIKQTKNNSSNKKQRNPFYSLNLMNLFIIRSRKKMAKHFPYTVFVSQSDLRMPALKRRNALSK